MLADMSFPMKEKFKGKTKRYRQRQLTTPTKQKKQKTENAYGKWNKNSFVWKKGKYAIQNFLHINRKIMIKYTQRKFKKNKNKYQHSQQDSSRFATFRQNKYIFTQNLKKKKVSRQLRHSPSNNFYLYKKIWI